jgi:hypothetical protein
MLSLLKTSRDLKMMFAAVTHPVEGLSLKTLLTLKMKKSLICFVGTWRPAVLTTEQHSILFLKIGDLNSLCQGEIQNKRPGKVYD